MRHLICGALAALLTATVSMAAPVDCAYMGSAVRYWPADPAAKLDRDYSNVETAGDAVIGAMGGFFLPTRPERTAGLADAAAYWRCESPGGGQLGAGVVAWTHRANSSTVPVPAASRVVVDVVDVGEKLTPAANAVAGTTGGATQAWPTTPFSRVAVPVHFGGLAVGESFTLRLRGEVGQQTLIAVGNALALDLDIAPPATAADDADALIAQLAAALGVDAGLLRALLGALVVPR